MKFAVPKPDGSVTIIAAASRENLEMLIGTPDENGTRHLSEADYRAHVLERNGLTESDVIDLPGNWAPPDGDRAFRNAWVMSGQAVTVDMPKAREIHIAKLRRSGEPTPQQLAAIAAARTPEELRAVSIAALIRSS